MGDLLGRAAAQRRDTERRIAERAAYDLNRESVVAAVVSLRAFTP
jgi:hypothetical protein